MLGFMSVCSGIEAVSEAWRDLPMKPTLYSEIEAFPIAVLEQRHRAACCRKRRPENAVPLWGDFSTMRIRHLRRMGVDLDRTDILIGGTPCFATGTLVTTAAGLVPIEDVHVGDLVLTHEKRWKRVLRVGSKMAGTITLRGQGHPGLVTTADHPFLACTKGARSTRVKGKSVRLTWTEGPEWKAASEMKGRHWASVADFPDSVVPIEPHFGNEVPMPPVSENLLWLAGAYLGDGWIRINERRGSVIFGVNAAKAEQIVPRVESVGMSVTISKERTSVRLHLTRRCVARWMDRHFGSGAKHKVIPGWALGLPAKLRRSLLDGYIATDGTPLPDGGWKCVTTSWRLALGIKMLSNSLGHASSLYHVINSRERCVIEGREVNESPYWTVTISISDRSSFEVDGLRYGLVRSVEPTGRVEMVHNLEVEGDNSYVADGIIVHNCQAFSMAGARHGLSDARGNLSLEFVRLANAIDNFRRHRGLPPIVIAWENVEGVFSMPDNAFGCFLAGLAGADSPLVQPRIRTWPNAGLVVGPRRTVAWRLLDAQYFGLAQRRRRVLVVASARRECVSEILFESESVRRDHPPSRETGQSVTHELAPCLGASGRGFSRAGETRGQDPVVAQAFGGNNTSGSIDVAACLNAHGGSGRHDFETETFIAHTLRGEGFDASEDGTGRGTPLVPVPRPVPIMASGCGGANSAGIGRAGDPAFTLDTTGAQAIAFSCKDHGADSGDIARSVGAMSHSKSHANAGGQVAVAYRVTGNDGAYASGDQIGALGTQTDPSGHVVMEQVQSVSIRGRDGGATAELGGDVSPAVRASQGGGDKAHALSGMTVRRLTPRECARLQGFPDDLTDVTYRGKPAADGPLYKALGNSMPVPMIRWLGRRIVRALACAKTEAAA